MNYPQSSRKRYRRFRDDYRLHRLDDAAEGTETEPGEKGRPGDSGEPAAAVPAKRQKRREYLREYGRWLWPHRYAVAVMFVLAVLTAGLQMVEPLFLRFIVDNVLLNAALDTAARLSRLNLAGALFVGVVIVSNLVSVLKDYRQRLLNVRVMLSLRRALFDRLLHLPLPKLWDMKTGGILSRLTGDVDTTTGLLQMAIVSPAISVIRLAIAVVILLRLNWRLAFTALAIIPGVMLISYTAARRIRPIYRSLRKDAEHIDGRVGETFSGIRVVRAFGRELRELLEYMIGRHTVLRKEMFAQRREMVIWTSWSLLLGAVNVVIVWYGGYLNVAGGASIGDIMAFQWYTFLLLNPVWQLVNSFSELQRSLAAMERVFQVLAMADDKPDTPGAIDAPRVVHDI
ncbi:MAG TPA: ABC transporter ATP-binding protein, partial [Vicinamibacterales bacterium]|nr:ABC transporter ATP-binding protein [Vicinamibacterales bacterium]